MSESITCPKCERTSYHPGDIEHRYCPKCGYHDAPVNAPMGVPGVSAKFRQPTPAMQAHCLVMGLEGQFHNWVEGINSDLDLRVEFQRFFEDYRELMQHLDTGKWPPDPNRPKPPAGGGIL